jgi:hypothetical protein
MIYRVIDALIYACAMELIVLRDGKLMCAIGWRAAEL